MAKCNRCGKGGLFRKLNQSGICIECEYQWNIDSLKIEIDSLTSLKSTRLTELDALKMSLSEKKSEYDKLYKEAKQQAKVDIFQERKNEIAKLDDKINTLTSVVYSRRKDIIQLEDTILLQEFGLYEPKFDFCNVEQYKNELTVLRNEQKACIKNGEAITGSVSWTVNGSKTQGNKLVKDTQKLLLRAFNSECDTLIEKVKYHNYSVFKKRIEKSRDTVSKLGKMMDIEISYRYLNLKQKELDLSFEYQMEKQAEKERQRELREQAREEKKLQKEIEESRKKLKKEQTHYMNELNHLQAQLLSAKDEHKNDIAEKIEVIESALLDIDKSIQDVDYREANQRAGYVYIISNIGSFGEGIYKIGMTRRLDPYERIYELSSASVPFNFDVHAMIFTEDAPGLEATLHRAFEPHKVNLVNQRREFFKVSLSEIKEEIRKNHDKIVEFFELPEAEQYRMSQKIRNTQLEVK